jgi:hypothetical protein
MAASRTNTQTGQIQAHNRQFASFHPITVIL